MSDNFVSKNFEKQFENYKADLLQQNQQNEQDKQYERFIEKDIKFFANLPIQPIKSETNENFKQIFEQIIKQPNCVQFKQFVDILTEAKKNASIEQDLYENYIEQLFQQSQNFCGIIYQAYYRTILNFEYEQKKDDEGQNKDIDFNSQKSNIIKNVNTLAKIYLYLIQKQNFKEKRFYPQENDKEQLNQQTFVFESRKDKDMFINFRAYTEKQDIVSNDSQDSQDQQKQLRNIKLFLENLEAVNQYYCANVFSDFNQVKFSTLAILLFKQKFFEQSKTLIVFKNRDLNEFSLQQESLKFQDENEIINFSLQKEIKQIRFKQGSYLDFEGGFLKKKNVKGFEAEIKFIGLDGETLQLKTDLEKGLEADMIQLICEDIHQYIINHKNNTAILEKINKLQQIKGLKKSQNNLEQEQKQNETYISSFKSLEENPKKEETFDSISKKNLKIFDRLKLYKIAGQKYTFPAEFQEETFLQILNSQKDFNIKLDFFLYKNINQEIIKKKNDSKKENVYELQQEIENHVIKFMKEEKMKAFVFGWSIVSKESQNYLIHKDCLSKKNYEFYFAEEFSQIKIFENKFNESDDERIKKIFKEIYGNEKKFLYNKQRIMKQSQTNLNVQFKFEQYYKNIFGAFLAGENSIDFEQIYFSQFVNNELEAGGYLHLLNGSIEEKTYLLNFLYYNIFLQKYKNTLLQQSIDVQPLIGELALQQDNVEKNDFQELVDKAFILSIYYFLCHQEEKSKLSSLFNAKDEIGNAKQKNEFYQKIEGIFDTQVKNISKKFQSLFWFFNNNGHQESFIDFFRASIEEKIQNIYKIGSSKGNNITKQDIDKEFRDLQKNLDTLLSKKNNAQNVKTLILSLNELSKTFAIVLKKLFALKYKSDDEDEERQIVEKGDSQIRNLFLMLFFKLNTYDNLHQITKSLKQLVNQYQSKMSSCLSEIFGKDAKVINETLDKIDEPIIKSNLIHLTKLNNSQNFSFPSEGGNNLLGKLGLDQAVLMFFLGKKKQSIVNKIEEQFEACSRKIQKYNQINVNLQYLLQIKFIQDSEALLAQKYIRSKGQDKAMTLLQINLPKVKKGYKPAEKDKKLQAQNLPSMFGDFQDQE